MVFLLVMFTVFGGTAFICIILFVALYPEEYFAAAFSNKAPKIFGANAATTNQVVAFWTTRVFLISFIGFISIYFYNLTRN